tara:strand:+ start:2482 stop:3270 length:789 start_codon:yes stop_codon:yes gene_type:complete
MSRYSYNVEKLLRESKSPSIRILLEDEEEAKSSEEEQPKSSSSEESEEGISDDPFGDSEQEDSGGDSEEPQDDDSEDPPDKEESSAREDANRLNQLEDQFKRSTEEGEAIDNRAHEFRGLAREFMSALNDLVVNENYNNKLYSSESITGFIFEDESQKSIEDRVKDLQQKLDSKENQLPKPLDIAKTSYRFFERFDDIDKAIYIIKLVSKFFKRFVASNKSQVFDEFLDNFISILRDNGVDLESNGMQATKFKTAVGARQAS